MPGNVARALTLALTTALALAPTLPQSLTLCRPPAGVNRHKKRAGNSVFARDCQHQREVKNLLPADKDAALQIKNLPAGRALHQVQVSADHRGPRPWPSPSPVERGRPSPPVRAYTQVHLNKRRMSEWDDCSTRSKGEGAVSLPLRVPLAAAELLRLRADGSARLSLTAADERVRGLLPVRTDGFMLPPWQLNCVMYALLAVMAQTAAQLGVASDPLFKLNPPLMTYRQLGAMLVRVRDSPAGALRLLRTHIDGWEVRHPQPRSGPQPPQIKCPMHRPLSLRLPR